MLSLNLAALPQEEQRTEADLADLAESAQLHHQLRILGAALQTAQLDPAQFGLNATVCPLLEFRRAGFWDAPYACLQSCLRALILSRATAATLAAWSLPLLVLGMKLSFSPAQQLSSSGTASRMGTKG